VQTIARARAVIAEQRARPSSSDAPGVWLAPCVPELGRGLSHGAPIRYVWGNRDNRIEAATGLPSFLMPCPCGDRMNVNSRSSEVHSDGTEDIRYHCSICRIELVATRPAKPAGLRDKFERRKSGSVLIAAS
jgi:hypothetical protein